MHRKVSCSLHTISCILRLPKAKLPCMLFHPLGQSKVLCVHFILSNEQQSSFLSVMPIQDLLKFKLRFLTRVVNT